MDLPSKAFCHSSRFFASMKFQVIQHCVLTSLHSCVLRRYSSSISGLLFCSSAILTDRLLVLVCHLFSCLLQSCIEDFHLLGIILLKPCVLRNLVMQELDGLFPRDLNGCLPVLMPVEPCFRPPTFCEWKRVIDTDGTRDVDGLHIYLEVGQRVYDTLTG